MKEINGPKRSRRKYEQLADKIERVMAEWEDYGQQIRAKNPVCIPCMNGFHTNCHWDVRANGCDCKVCGGNETPW